MSKLCRKYIYELFSHKNQYINKKYIQNKEYNINFVKPKL